MAEKHITYYEHEDFDFKRLTLDDLYAVTPNFMEIEICNPETHGKARNSFTHYEVRMKTNISKFKLHEYSVRRRYREFLWFNGGVS